MLNLWQGDITTLKVDAIINAANPRLLGGGGVDGAIHRAAGPGLLAECRTLNGCDTGQAKITKGHNLAATYIIHTVGPIWHDGNRGEANLLRQCYLNSLALAHQHKCTSIAFPAISTGAYMFPEEEAAYIATSTIHQWLGDSPTDMDVTLVAYDDESFGIIDYAMRTFLTPRAYARA